ncbi:MAG: hypothetical protein CMD92_07125 [Gammaproteobacteria bacterium]|nr:hypothetical protein [Gammaproteobacteria bacterium]
MRKSAHVLHERSHREGRGTAARRVARNKDVVNILRRLANVVIDWVRYALHHCINVGRVEGLLGAVGRDAERLAQTANNNQRVTGARANGEEAGDAHSIAGSSAHAARAYDQNVRGRSGGAWERTGEQRADRLDLLGREPTRHGGQLVSTFFG